MQTLMVLTGASSPIVNYDLPQPHLPVGWGFSLTPASHFGLNG